MTSKPDGGALPLGSQSPCPQSPCPQSPWMSDAGIRRAIAEQIKQRRAKRKRALAAFESAVRLAEHGATKVDR